MVTTSWQTDVDKLHKLLSEVSFRDIKGKELGADTGFSHWQNLTTELRNNSNTIYLVGNGASASMACHLATDLAKNACIYTRVFSDASLLTAVSNDICYEKVFSEPLRWMGQKGDMLIAISSSGRSLNVLNAAEVARNLNFSIVTLSAMKADNPLRALGDLNLYVAAETYGDAETCHAALLHRWMDSVEISAA